MWTQVSLGQIKSPICGPEAGPDGQKQTSSHSIISKRNPSKNSVHLLFSPVPQEWFRTSLSPLQYQWSMKRKIKIQKFLHEHSGNKCSSLHDYLASTTQPITRLLLQILSVRCCCHTFYTEGCGTWLYKRSQHCCKTEYFILRCYNILVTEFQSLAEWSSVASHLRNTVTETNQNTL